jgi:hypothetical protein
MLTDELKLLGREPGSGRKARNSIQRRAAGLVGVVHDTTLSGATFNASRLSAIARVINRAVIGVPS